MMDLSGPFAVLAGIGPPASGIRTRDVADGVAIGLTANGTRVVLVAIEDDEHLPRDTTSRGVWVLRYDGPDGPGDGASAILECRDPRLDLVFTTMAGEIAAALTDVPHGDRARVVRARLDRWRDLLAPGPSTLPSVSRQQGLLAELLVLERRIAADPHGALESWRGPRQRGRSVDFRWGGTALEVKSTTAPSGFTVTIHGLGQLDAPPSGADLYVVGIRLVEEPDGETVPDVVDGLLATTDAREFLRLLRLWGYDHSAGEEGWTAFSLDTMSLWPVEPTAPALRASSLPDAWRNAITNVTYDLDLTALGEPLEGSPLEEFWE